MFRSILVTLVGFGAFASLHAEPSTSLTVAVTAIEEVKGAIMLAMFDTEDAYDGGGPPVKAVKIEVTGEQVSVSFDDLPAGRYAIKLYHDANGNGELDSNAFGLPTEGYGFSGKGGRFGPPPFDKAAFDVAEGEDNSVSIQLR